MSRKEREPFPRLQVIALTGYEAELDELIEKIRSNRRKVGALRCRRGGGRRVEVPQTRRLEPEELRAEASRLEKKERELRSEQAAEIREPRDTAATHAQQIQALTLRNVGLETGNARLVEQLQRVGENVTVLPVSRLSP
jgi:predicted  nucleic acid-binding Zn-ribbon protein